MTIIAEIDFAPIETAARKFKLKPKWCPAEGEIRFVTRKDDPTGIAVQTLVRHEYVAAEWDGRGLWLGKPHANITDAVREALGRYERQSPYQRNRISETLRKEEY